MLRFAGLERVVTVAMPRSLPELQHMAAQNFGHSGCLRLFHHGTSLIYSPAQMNQIKDGDIIVIRKSDCFRPVTADTPLSTHQADFTKRAFQRPVTGSGSDYDSTLTDGTKGERLDSMSRYAMDFVRHPIQPRTPFKPPSALHLTNDRLGTTTYAREFPWRENSARKAVVDDRAVRESSLSMASMSQPFEGFSSYTIDYPRRPHTAAQEISTRPHTVDSLQPPPTPFSSDTTYNSDFKKLGRGRQRTAKPKAAYERTNDPFVGTSEYRREYHELSMGATDRSEIIRLTEEAFQGQDAKEICAAVEAALREAGELEVLDSRYEIPA